jgi:hypothetical protein
MVKAALKRLLLPLGTESPDSRFNGLALKISIQEGIFIYFPSRCGKFRRLDRNARLFTPIPAARRAVALIEELALRGHGKEGATATDKNRCCSS